MLDYKNIAITKFEELDYSTYYKQTEQIFYSHIDKLTDTTSNTEVQDLINDTLDEVKDKSVIKTSMISLENKISDTIETIDKDIQDYRYKVQQEKTQIKDINKKVQVLTEEKDKLEAKINSRLDDINNHLNSIINDIKNKTTEPTTTLVTKKLNAAKSQIEELKNTTDKIASWDKIKDGLENSKEHINNAIQTFNNTISDPINKLCEKANDVLNQINELSDELNNLLNFNTDQIFGINIGSQTSLPNIRIPEINYPSLNLNPNLPDLPKMDICSLYDFKNCQSNLDSLIGGFINDIIDMVKNNIDELSNFTDAVFDETMGIINTILNDLKELKKLFSLFNLNLNTHVKLGAQLGLDKLNLDLQNLICSNGALDGIKNLTKLHPELTSNFDFNLNYSSLISNSKTISLSKHDFIKIV